VCVLIVPAGSRLRCEAALCTRLYIKASIAEYAVLSLCLHFAFTSEVRCNDDSDVSLPDSACPDHTNFELLLAMHGWMAWRKLGVSALLRNN
jgi:hypothetical protein